MSKNNHIVDMDIWYRINQTLKIARHNTFDLLNDALNNAQGDSENTITKRENAVVQMYEIELSEINSLLDYTTEHDGVPF